jgi:hypothetical protein
VEQHAAHLRRPLEELAAEPYWHTDHTAMFEAFFAELERHGVEPIATLRNSVVYDAGARYVPLDEAVERFAAPRRRPVRPLSVVSRLASGARHRATRRPTGAPAATRPAGRDL